uniref:Rela-spot homolog family protein n=1 Tax=Rhizophora mucronata TaxID=61149 RepID=A0A2P2MT60_RHIMU
MHAIQNHWMECPSRLCQEATLLARQLSRPGKTSWFDGIFTCTIFATPFPWNNKPSLASKLTFCKYLLHPLILGTLVLPFFLFKKSPKLFSGYGFSTAFMKIFSHRYLFCFPLSDISSASLFPSESAMKSFTVSTLISVADGAA